MILFIMEIALFPTPFRFSGSPFLLHFIQGPKKNIIVSINFARDGYPRGRTIREVMKLPLEMIKFLSNMSLGAKMFKTMVLTMTVGNSHSDVVGIMLTVT